MYCTKCGKFLKDNWIKCPYCGTMVSKKITGNDTVDKSIKKLKEKNQSDIKRKKQLSLDINEETSVNPVNSMYNGQEFEKIKFKSFWKYLLLSLITFGIYGIYFLYGYTKDINKLCQKDGKESKNYIVVCLLSIITFGIYGLYWWYVQGERLYNIAPVYNINVRERGSNILLWEILGCTIMPGIGMFVAMYIMFDNMNIIAKAYNGELTRKDLPQIKKPHPHLIRNVLIGYGVFVIIVIVSIIFMLYTIFTDDTSEEGKINRMTEEISYSDINIEELIGQSEEILKDTDFTYDEDELGYQLLDGDVVADSIDGTIHMVMITGDEELTPNYHGVKIGMTIEEADVLLGDRYAYADETEGEKEYIDLNSRISVWLFYNGNIITQILAMNLTEEEIQSYSGGEYIFSDSDKKYLSEDEVRSVTAENMLIGRNEIFARHGYIFQDEGLKAYFESMSWYEGTVPSDQFNSEAVFNDFEKKNVELIKRVEDEINGVGQANVGQAAEPFIGMEGVYICTSAGDGDFTGKISVSGISNDSVNLTLGCLDLSYDVATVQGQIVDSKTVQANLSEFSITLIWSDSENMIALGQGELMGMDAGVIMGITDNQSYTRPFEFNQW